MSSYSFGVYPLLNHPSFRTIEICLLEEGLVGVIGETFASLLGVPKEVGNLQEKAKARFDESSYLWEGDRCRVRLSGKGGGCTSSSPREEAAELRQRPKETLPPQIISPPVSASAPLSATSEPIERRIELVATETLPQPPPPVLEAPLQAAYPSLWAVPLRLESYTGREGLFREVNKLLLSDPNSAKVVISGMGGGGKTAFTTEFVYRHVADFQRVFWISDEHPLSDYRAIGESVGLVKPDDRPEIVVEKVKTWFEAQKGLLLVFDNAFEPKDLDNYLPIKGTAKVIVTTRNPHWLDAVELPEFTIREGTELLFKLTLQRDPESAKTICERLGLLPLGVGQAGRYIAATSTSLSKYIELFDEARPVLWSVEESPSGYKYNLAKVFKISEEELSKENPAYITPLVMASFCASDNIPRELLMGSEEERDLVNVSLHKLIQYGLISAGSKPKSITIHRLTQASTLDSKSDEVKEQAKGTLYTRMEKCWPFKDEDALTWKPSRDYFLHLKSLCGHTKSSHQEAKARSLHELGDYLMRVEIDLLEALRLHQEAVQIRQAAFGKESIEHGNGLLDLSRAYEHQGNIPQAIQIAQEAMEIFKAKGDKDRLAYSHRCLGSYLASQGSLKTSEEHFLKALELRRETAGAESNGVAEILNRLGLLYGEMKRPKEAKDYLLEFLRICTLLKGEKSEEVATALSNLAIVETDQDQRIAHLEKALQIRLDVSGEKNPQLILNYQNLATAYMSQTERRTVGLFSGHTVFTGRSKVIPLYQKALKLAEEIYGKDHLEVAEVLTYMAQVYQTLEEPEKARACALKVLEIQEKVLGDSHPDLGPTFAEFAEQAEQEKDHQKALEFYTKTLNILRGTSGENDISVAHTLFNIGEMYRNLGRFQEAITSFRGELAIYQVLQVEKEEDTGLTYMKIALCYENLGDFVSASETYTEKFIADGKKSLGPFTAIDAYQRCQMDCLIKVSKAARDCLEADDFDGAIRFLQQELVVKEKFSDFDHPSAYGDTHYEIGMVHHKKGDLSSALSSFEEGLRLAISDPKLNERNQLKYYDALVVIHEKLGNVREGLNYRIKALEVAKKERDPSEVDIASRNILIGAQYKALEDYRNSLIFYQEAVTWFRKRPSDLYKEIHTTVEELVVVAEYLKDEKLQISYSLEALEILKAHFGLNHPVYCKRALKVAQLYERVGEEDRALPYFEAAQKATQGEETNIDPFSALDEQKMTLLDLQEEIDTLISQERFDEVLVPANRKLELIKSFPEIENKFLLVVAANQNIGAIYMLKNEFKTSLFYYNEAYQLLTSHSEGHESECLQLLGSIIVLHFQLNNYEEEIKYRHKQLEINRKGPEANEEIGTNLRDLGACYRDKKDYKESLVYSRQAYDWFKKYPEGHEEEIAPLLDHLVIVCMKLPDSEKEIFYRLEFIEYVGEHQGKTSVGYGEKVQDLAYCYHKIGRGEEALPYYETCLEVLNGKVAAEVYAEVERNYQNAKTESPISRLSRKAIVSLNEGDMGRTMDLLREKVGLIESSTEEDRFLELAETYKNLAIASKASNDVLNALKYIEDALKLLKLDPQDHDDLHLSILEFVINVHFELKNVREEIKYRLEALEILKKGPQEDTKLGFALRDLGACYKDEGVFDESFAYYKQCYEWFTKYPEGQDEELHSALKNLEFLTRNSGDMEGEISYRLDHLPILKKMFGEGSRELVVKLLELAEAYYDARNTEEAINCLEQGLAIAPDNEKMKKYLAILYQRRDQKIEELNQV